MNTINTVRARGLLFLVMAVSSTEIYAQKTPSACDPGSFQISKPITIDSNFSFKKKQINICIKEEGRFHVRAGGQLNFKDITITLLNNTPPTKDGGFIKLDPGSTLRLNRVKLISKKLAKFEETKDSESGALGINGSENIINGKTSGKLGIRLEISDSQLSSEHPYSSGGISITSAATNAKPVSGWIINTQFQSIWVPIMLSHAKKFKIINNIFKRNPGSNIAISGTEIIVAKNDIIFPGNGYIGDGITVFQSLSRSKIIDNNITGGSCYGIWFYNSEFHDVLVAKNRISSGVTTGLNITNDKKLKSDNLLIKGNHFTGNAGFGVGIDKDVAGVTLASNYFIGNAPSFGDNDIAISNAAVATIEDSNISAQAIGPEWAKELNPYRTHVNQSLRILRY